MFDPKLNLKRKKVWNKSNEMETERTNRTLNRKIDNMEH